MTEAQARAYNRLLENSRKASTFSHILSLLRWDQETYMPMGAIAERAVQIAVIEGMYYETVAAEEVGELLELLGSGKDSPAGFADLPEDTRAFLRRLHYEYQQASALPLDLVKEMAEQSSLATSAWARAREENDTAIFFPYFERLLKLIRQTAECIGYGKEEDAEPYDALLSRFEPWMKTSTVRSIFNELEANLPAILEPLYQRKKSGRIPKLQTSKAVQKRISEILLKTLKFDSARARLDCSAHPFCTTLGSHDVRITTRYNALLSSFFSVLHEYGHALYELNVAEKWRGTLLASGTSMMVHESQSRIWENCIGRSPAFWYYWYPRLQREVPQLENFSKKDFLQELHRVERQSIRIEADEISYNMHIILRFKLEVALLNGDIVVQDLQEAWNKEAQELLGLRPNNNAEGVLQDIHWAHAAMGYFPTYALGNLYAAQLFATMEKEISVDDMLREGSVDGIIAWLQKNVHIHGCSRTADEIINDVTGEKLQSKYFIEYVQSRYCSYAVSE